MRRVARSLPEGSHERIELEQIIEDLKASDWDEESDDP